MIDQIKIIKIKTYFFLNCFDFNTFIFLEDPNLHVDFEDYMLLLPLIYEIYNICIEIECAVYGGVHLKQQLTVYFIPSDSIILKVKPLLTDGTIYIIR